MIPYAKDVKKTLDEQAAAVYKSKAKEAAAVGVLELEDAFNERLKSMDEKVSEQMAKRGESAFAGYKEHCLASDVPAVLVSSPPTYLVGNCGDEEKEILTAETEMATVRLVEVVCDYVYSNPDGQFNLSAANKLLKQKNYQTISYKNWKTAEEKKKLEDAGEKTDDVEIDIKTKSFTDDGKKGACLLKVVMSSKAKSLNTVKVTFTIADDENKNVRLPLTQISERCFSDDQKVAALFLKIDPSKEGWGDIKMMVESEVFSAGSGSGVPSLKVDEGPRMIT